MMWFSQRLTFVHLQHPHPKESTWWALVLLRLYGSSRKLALEIWNLKNFSYLYSHLWHGWVLDFLCCTKNYSWNHILKYCVPPYLLRRFCANLSVCNCCLFLTQYSYNNISPRTVTAEFRSFAVPLECLLKADLKMYHMITAISVNGTVWDLLDLILIFYGFMKFRTRMGKFITAFNCTNKKGYICCLKHFLQHACNFQHILCTILPFFMS